MARQTNRQTDSVQIIIRLYNNIIILLLYKVQKNLPVSIALTVKKLFFHDQRLIQESVKQGQEKNPDTYLVDSARNLVTYIHGEQLSRFWS